MPKIEIDLDPTVLAHLTSAGDGDTIRISIAMGSREGKSTPVPVKPTGELGELMEAGLLKANDKLGFYQPRAKRTGRATVTAEGQLIVEGHPKPFSSVSGAAGAVTGNVINGWTLWHTDGGSGPTLDELRGRL